MLEQKSATEVQTSTQKVTRFDRIWVLNLFGTAVGAGVLFLPINAGMGGFWPLLIMVLLVGPMTYLAHRGLTQFVLSSARSGSDITEVVEEHFGSFAGKAITLLYFFAIYPILLIYGVGITNTVISFIENQMHMTAPPRAVVSFILIAAFIIIMLAGEKIVLKVTEWLVYPLVLILFGLSIYLIPEWNTAFFFNEIPDAKTFLTTIWLTIPVLVFSFNHSPAISSFAISASREYHQNKENIEFHTNATLKRTATILLFFVMFFVFSCVFTLTPEDLLQAKHENISILSFLANRFDNPYITYLGPLVAFLAISSSFFGHYMGTREGLIGLFNKINRDAGKPPVNYKKLNYLSGAFFFVTLWIVATLNPSIINLIESLGGPIIAMILFIMPMYAIRKLPEMKRYQGRLSNVFVTIMGLIAISAVVYGLF